MTILIGLIFISLLVVIHEFGHFLMARACGVEVETFSVGWGPILLKRKFGKTEYRLSAIPLGGYCGMKGEQAFKTAIEEKLSEIPYEAGSLYSVSPFRRILIAFAGPFANVLTAMLALAIVSAMGATYQTSENRIVPLYVYDATDDSPAKTAGLQTGDTILKIGNTAIMNYSDIQRTVMIHPNEALLVTIERDGERFTKTITPRLNKKTGAGYLGVYPYIPTIIEQVIPEGAAERSGLMPHDIVVRVNDTPVTHLFDLLAVLDNTADEAITLTVKRNNEYLKKIVPIIYTADRAVDLGITWQHVTVTKLGTGFFASLKAGVLETKNTFFLTLKSLSLLFQGIDLQEAVSGPLRISHMLGEVAESAVTQNIKAGITNILYFISVISISLFVMNLLPIPVFDGGLIFMAVVQIIIRRQVRPRTLYYTQFIGFILIAFIFVFALWGDIRFLLGR